MAKIAKDAAALDAATIDALLPQTQCGQCGYGACMPYAIAITQGQVINRCPPGGDVLIQRLARLTGRKVIPLDISRGKHVPYRQVALIDEDRCIGCTKCLPVCPVDAIVGGPKRLHSVVQQSCTGCELCIAPCPVDCITLVGINEVGTMLTDDFDAAVARHAYSRHQTRMNSIKNASETENKVTDQAIQPLSEKLTKEALQSVLANALARAQEQRSHKKQ